MPVRRKVGNDLLRRHPDPVVFQPSIPAIFGMLSLAKFNLERSLNGVTGIATGLRIFVPIEVLVIVGTLQVFQKCLIRPVRPLAFDGIVGIWVVWPTVVENDVLEFVRVGKRG